MAWELRSDRADSCHPPSTLMPPFGCYANQQKMSRREIFPPSVSHIVMTVARKGHETGLRWFAGTVRHAVGHQSTFRRNGYSTRHCHRHRKAPSQRLTAKVAPVLNRLATTTFGAGTPSQIR
ncbi:hypothetical protein LIA77_05021 [Sarocladium implicatum]|nr:hypothetical protein LIA77_05021 [Sarocladium implicatum]